MEQILARTSEQQGQNIFISELSSNKYSYFNLPIINLEIVEFENVKQYYSERYFLFRQKEGRICAVVSDKYILENFPKVPSGSTTMLICDGEFTELLETIAADQNTRKAKYELEHLFPKSSARTIDYKKRILGFAIAFATFLLAIPAIFCLANNLLYLIHNLFKTALFIFSGAAKTEKKKIHFSANSSDLPIYSILVPLYQEKEKLWTIIESISNLNYPKDKLDVKLIVEADDHLTIDDLSLAEIPSFIHVIKVPYSKPRTKPKAMNYAMSYVRGEYLVIYDAEDVPDPNQLLDALNRFENLSEDYVCLQARLNFYNANENFLTRFFSLEYSLWFNYLLKGLASTSLPVPLGGTSNHFKTKTLVEIGAWDAYNVTEDADLGIRIFRNGYKVHVFDSVTLEESPISLRSWLHQRSRWIKGFMQTTLVFMRAQKENKLMSFTNRMSIYLFVGLSSYSFLSLPWLIIGIYVSHEKWVVYSLLISSILSVAYMYSTAFIVMWDQAGKVKDLSRMDVLVLLCWPFYFLLHTVASYIALYQSVSNPFKWNKTRHGVSAHTEK